MSSRNQRRSMGTPLVVRESNDPSLPSSNSLSPSIPQDVRADTSVTYDL